MPPGSARRGGSAKRPFREHYTEPELQAMRDALQELGPCKAAVEKLFKDPRIAERAATTSAPALLGCICGRDRLSRAKLTSLRAAEKLRRLHNARRKMRKTAAAAAAAPGPARSRSACSALPSSLDIHTCMQTCTRRRQRRCARCALSPQLDLTRVEVRVRRSVLSYVLCQSRAVTGAAAARTPRAPYTPSEESAMLDAMERHGLSAQAAMEARADPRFTERFSTTDVASVLGARRCARCVLCGRSWQSPLCRVQLRCGSCGSSFRRRSCDTNAQVLGTRRGGRADEVSTPCAQPRLARTPTGWSSLPPCRFRWTSTLLRKAGLAVRVAFTRAIARLR